MAATDIKPNHGGPLCGLQVVEFAGLTPVSVAGMMLADMGARVIRIDRRAHAADDENNTLRRGRESVVIDLKKPDGVAVARDLVASADILLEAYRPGVMERLGLGPTELQALNSRLIYGRLTGWGQDGPMAQAAGHDITYLALTGALHPLGPMDGPPMPPLNYVADMGGGTLFLLVGVLAALSERTRSGQGQVVDAAMVNGVPLLGASALRAIAQGAWDGQRGSFALDGSAPFYRCYRCKRGGYIAVGAIEPEFYAEFVRGLGLKLDELPEQQDRSAWPQLSDIFADRIAQRSRAEWERQFEGTDACVAPVLAPNEAPHHPHMLARGAFIDLGGSYQPAPAPALSRTPLGVTTSAPLRGEHTRTVLARLGKSPGEIQALLASGALYQPKEMA